MWNTREQTCLIYFSRYFLWEKASQADKVIVYYSISNSILWYFMINAHSLILSLGQFGSSALTKFWWYFRSQYRLMKSMQNFRTYVDFWRRWHSRRNSTNYPYKNKNQIFLTNRRCMGSLRNKEIQSFNCFPNNVLHDGDQTNQGLWILNNHKCVRRIVRWRR